MTAGQACRSEGKLLEAVANGDQTGTGSLPRSFGHARISFTQGDDGRTRAGALFQEGCLKLRLPRVGPDETELVIMNTAGGMTGGDVTTTEVTVEEGARVTATAPGSERIYRALSGNAVMNQRLRVDRGGRLDWLPQETILFNRGRLARRTEVDLQEGAVATIVESILLGRAAMGETVTSGHLSDLWTVRRGGRLIFADALRLADPFPACTGHPATLDGNRAMATIIHAGEGLGALCDSIREHFAGLCNAIAGAGIVNGILLVRIVAGDAMALRRAMIPALSVLRDGRAVPRLWNF